MSGVKSVSELLSQLEAMRHTERWNVMVSVGRKSVTPPDDSTMQPIVLTLAKSAVHYERLLAAMSLRGAAAACNPLPAPLAEACRNLFLDPSSTIYRIVQQPLVRTSTDDVLLQLLKTCPTRQFRILTKKLAKMGRITVLHRLYADVGGSKKGTSKYPAERLALLSGFMPADAAAALTVEEQSSLTPEAVKTLTLRHPDLMVDRLIAAVKAACEGDADSEVTIIPQPLEASLLAALDSLTDPKNMAKGSVPSAVKLMEGTLYHVRLNNYPQRRRVSTQVERLATRALFPVVEYLLSHLNVYTPSWSFDLSKNALDKLRENPQMVKRLAKANILGAISGRAQDFFASLPKETRAYFWQNERDAFPNDNGVVQWFTANSVPVAKEREALAEQMFNHKSLQAEPPTRLQYLAVLPFPKAKELAEPFITDPSPDIRIATVAPLVRTVQYHSEFLGDVLDYFLLRKKEQDLYRRSMFQAVATIPTQIWNKHGQVAAHIPKVIRLVQDALDAKDVSEATLTCARSVLVNLIEHDPQAVAPVIVSVVKPYRQLRGPRDIHNAAPAVARLLAEALVPFFKGEMKTHGCNEMANVLFEGFGNAHVRRMWAQHFRTIADACLADKQVGAIRCGLDKYRQFDNSGGYMPVVRALLGKSQDAILLDTCNMAVALIEQGELLNAAVQPVDDEKFTGAFRDDIAGAQPIHYVTFDTRRYGRMWTAKQQNTYAKTLTDALEDYCDGDYAKISKMINMVGAMPSVDFSQSLRKFAQLDYESERTRSITISVMGKLQDESSMNELLAALNDTRVGDATVAIQSRLRGWSSESVLRLLQPLLFATKAVGVQKQLVRFLGSCGDEGAYQCLTEFRNAKSDSEMHPDVRVALAAAFYPFLDRAEVWDFYDTLLTSSRTADVIALTSIPDSLLREPWQLARMNTLLLGMLKHSEGRVQSAALTRLSSNPIRLEDARIYEVLLANLSRTRERNIQSSSLSCIFEFRNEPVELAATAIAKLKDSALRDCVQLISFAGRRSSGPASVARIQSLATLVANSLIASRRQTSLVVQLVFQASPPSRWVEQVTKLADEQLLHAGAQNAVLDQVRMQVHRHFDELSQLEKSVLREHPNALIRHMGLHIISEAISRESWDADLIAGVKSYRADTDPWVRDDALLVTYRGEDEDVSEPQQRKRRGPFPH